MQGGEGCVQRVRVRLHEDGIRRRRALVRVAVHRRRAPSSQPARAASHARVQVSLGDGEGGSSLAIKRVRFDLAVGEAENREMHDQADAFQEQQAPFSWPQSRARRRQATTRPIDPQVGTVAGKRAFRSLKRGRGMRVRRRPRADTRCGRTNDKGNARRKRFPNAAFEFGYSFCSSSSSSSTSTFCSSSTPFRFLFSSDQRLGPVLVLHAEASPSPPQLQGGLRRPLRFALPARTPSELDVLRPPPRDLRMRGIVLVPAFGAPQQADAGLMERGGKERESGKK